MARRYLPGLLLLPILLAGCKAPAQTAAPPLPPPQVTVTQPVHREVTDYREFTGRTEAVEVAQVRARVRGFLQKVHFQEGAEVKQGDVLYEIDPRTFQADLERTQAEANRQETQLQLATAEAERARAAGRAVSEEDLQQRIAAREAARAAVRQAQAAVESARLELSFTKIYAPISGRISRTLVTEGNLVGFNEPTLLTTIMRMDKIYVYFQASERDFLEYQDLIRHKGAATATQAQIPVFVGLTTEQDYPHQGVIDFRDNRVDPNTGTMLLRGELPNPQRILVPGLFARVRVPIGPPRPRLLVPEVALSADQRGQYLLLVLPDNTVEQRYVTVGATMEGLLIIEQGLNDGERVVINGLQRARPGAKVQPLPPGEHGGNAPPQNQMPPGTGGTPPPHAPSPPPSATPGSVR
jgi:multidrug efflux system membrane fusion protein